MYAAAVTTTPMLISIHIPKCAGTSFRRVLQQTYGDQLCLNYGGIFSREQSHPGFIPPHAQCVHGHFLADALDGLVAEPTYITWMRHPVERVVSNYYHFLRSPDERDTCCRALHEQHLTLRQFAELDWMRNEATRYLATKTLADFAFIGVAERFAESLEICAEYLGWSQPLAIPRENANPHRQTAAYELTPRDFNYILALNATDLAAYETARVRLDQALQRRTGRVA
jgi:hypothetical protein